MKKRSVFSRKTVQDGIFRSSEQEKTVETRPSFYLKLLLPILLFPVLYLPYTLWWRADFAALAAQITQGSDAQLVQLMLTGNNTILLFWCLVTVVVMAAALVISILKLRPWYLIPLYLAVMFSLCGVFSLLFYTAILG